MDLNYPSSKIKNFSNELNNIDRRFGSIILSNPRIYVQEKVIKGKFKKKCIHLIIND
jgi:argonaute-like protein implicated in RNA metabolism and viral defense